MVQGINKNHPKNIIKSTFDGVIYQYNGFEWVKCEPSKTYITEDEWKYTRPIKLHKAYEIESATEYQDSDIRDGDYLAIYRTNYNDVLGSELLNDETKWKKYKTKLNEADTSTKQTVGITKNGKIIMPENKDFCYNLYINVGTNPVEHYISQEFITKPDMFYCFSSFFKPMPTKPASKVGLSIYLGTYDISICCRFDINDISGYTNNYKILPTSDIFFINDNGSTVTNTSFENYSAGIQLFPVPLDNGGIDYYFRPFLITKIKGNTVGKLKISQLNPNGDWKFAENEIQYGNYVSGVQLEIKNTLMDKPTRYITTQNSRNFKRTLQNTYIYETNRWVDRSDKKIYYVDDVVERTLETVNASNAVIRYTVMDSSKPAITNPNINDIALVSSVIVFTRDDNYTAEEHISGVKLGNNFKETDEAYTFYYDNYENVYKIKVPKEGSQDEYEYVNLKSFSDGTNKSIIAKSMIYNQGYFETYCERSNYRPRFGFGFNTGGNYNFWKTKYLKHNHH